MPNRKSTRLFAVILAGSAGMAMFTSPASAQGMQAETWLTSADANDDGDISWDEVMTVRADSFAKLDRNRDGVISADDSPARPFAARFNDAFAKVKASFDGDRDGQVTRKEMLNAPAPMFEQGDVDDNGILTAEEIAALKPENAPL